MSFRFCYFSRREIPRSYKVNKIEKNFFVVLCNFVVLRYSTKMNQLAYIAMWGHPRKEANSGIRGVRQILSQLRVFIELRWSVKAL